MYLLMPDRFANGDPKNDVVKGTMRQRAWPATRCTPATAATCKGIEHHFDYLKELGVTAIWPTPVVENDMPKASYHGYALTDYYAVDPRYGTNDDYVRFVQQCPRQGPEGDSRRGAQPHGQQNYLCLGPAGQGLVSPVAHLHAKATTATRPFNDPYASAQDRKLFSDDVV